MKKIAIIGPECTGKSWLSRNLAEHFDTLWVPEYAREYLNQLDRPYQRSDLLSIAKGQIESEDRLTEQANELIFCDTNLYVIKIWSEHKFGQCDPWILEEIAKRKYNLHLLTSIDIPWEEDPQREHPQMRKYFFDVYHNEMIHIKTKFSVIKGLNDSRLKAAIQAVKRIL